MIKSSLDKLISKITVRLKTNDNDYIGSGVIFYQDTFKDNIYILTAAHCLFVDGDKFQNQREEISIDILKSNFTDYGTIKIQINPELLFTEINKDVAVLVVNKKEIENIIGEIPKISSIKERSSYNDFITKGFPKATLGEEIAVLYPTWLQNIDNRFQLQLNENYAAYATKGFSGSGIFLIAKNEIYLYGIFTRFRAEEKGKVIYCQYIETINELLSKKYLPQIAFSYFGNHGLTKDFFSNHIENAIVGLGPRFTETLNFKLPIAKNFNDIAKDTLFFKRFLSVVDEWILGYGYRKINDNIHLDKIESEYAALKTKVTAWIKGLDNSVIEKIDAEWIYESFNQLEALIEAKSSELYKLRREEEKLTEETKKDYSYRPHYEAETSRLREINGYNHDFIHDLTKKTNIKLANNPCLIIKGEAGNGKSHLLGDIAKTRTNKNLPTLLLLGQNFNGSRNVWENIISELNLSCSNKELLIELNNIGKQIGSRVLVMIDAINEGGGAGLWQSRIAEFINDFKDYPYIGLVLTIRTTYLDYVIPKEVLNNPKITIINHEGFKGNEYAALKLFCEFHNLKQPHFPILAPEFTKPLFLKLMCEAVKETPEKTFPQGFQGISNIFKIYIQSLNTKFEKKREEYKNRKIVEKAIHLLAHECFGKDRRILLLDEGMKLFDEKFPSFNNLLNDLIEENVFIKRIDYNYESKKNEEVIYFSYERLGDFFIAEDLLYKYKKVDELKITFQKDNTLGKLIDFNYWQHHGLLEAFAVLLPEDYNVEIFEVFEWVFTDKSIEPFRSDEYKHNINKFLFDSLNWRKIESINDEKLTNWFSSKNFRIDDDEIFLKLVELSPIIGHPFNSDRLFKILKRSKMPKRDSFWQKHMLWFNKYNDDGNAYPIRRLIDWAWTPFISEKLDTETTRLTAQTLAWLLASTNRKLRDQTTKALVNLLEQQTDALLTLLKTFKSIDDIYILERLYAVAYGCVLRTDKNEDVIKIAKVVYEYVFKKGNPPKHILLRDYARNTIEYAVYKNPNLKFDLNLVRPPYNSKMPEYLPTEEEVLKFNYPHDDPKSKIDYRYMNNRIFHSVTGFGDFSKHIDGRLDDFATISFTFEKEYNLFFDSLNSKQKKGIKSIISVLKIKTRTTKNKAQFTRIINDESYKELLQSINDLCNRQIIEVENLFEGEQRSFFTNKVIKHLKSKYETNDWKLSKTDTNSFKYWIIKRTFELGYNSKIHGDYEKSTDNYNHRSDSKIERIGKKYQIIAFMEMLAMISDNYQISKFSWSRDKKYELYKGPWQLYSRDIDPAFTSNHINIEDNENNIDDILENKNWWDEPAYNNWKQSDADWVENLIDLPLPKQVLQKEDEDSNEWLSIIKTAKWQEPKSLGVGKYEGRRKEIFYKIQGYLINKRDKERTIAWLIQQNFWGNWMPETSSPINIINREKFWSPAYLDIDKEKKWETIRDTNLKVIIASTDAVGEISEDKSGAHFYYDMPCKTLFEGMILSYAPIDGEFKNSQNEIVVKNINYKGLMIKKNDLLSFLEKNKLDIIWTILGEKMSYASNDNLNNYFKQLSGVFYLEENEIKGRIISFNEE